MSSNLRPQLFLFQSCFVLLALCLCSLTWADPHDSNSNHNRPVATNHDATSSSHHLTALRRHQREANATQNQQQPLRATIMSLLPELLDLRGRLVAGEINESQHHAGLLALLERCGPDIFHEEDYGGRQQEFINSLADVIATVAQREAMGVSHEGSSHASLRGRSSGGSHPLYPRFSEDSNLVRLPTAGSLQGFFDLWYGYQMAAVKDHDYRELQIAISAKFRQRTVFTLLRSLAIAIVGAIIGVASHQYDILVGTSLLAIIYIVYNESFLEVSQNTIERDASSMESIDHRSQAALNQTSTSFAQALDHHLRRRLIDGETTVADVNTSEASENATTTDLLATQYQQPIERIAAAISRHDLPEAVQVLTSTVCGHELEHVSTTLTAAETATNERSGVRVDLAGAGDNSTPTANPTATTASSNESSMASNPAEITVPALHQAAATGSQ